MANPNNVYKHSARKLILAKEEIRNTRKEADELKQEMIKSAMFYMVKITRFKTGARPNKYNGFKQDYDYAIRGYKKLQ